MDPSDPLWEFRIKSYRATMCIQRQEKVCLQIKRSEWSFPGLVPLGPFSPAFFFPLSWLLPGLPSRLILLYQSILSRCSSRLNCALSTLLYPLFLGSLILPVHDLNYHVHTSMTPNGTSKIRTSHSDCRLYSSTLDISTWSTSNSTCPRLNSYSLQNYPLFSVFQLREKSHSPSTYMSQKPRNYS